MLGSISYIFVFFMNPESSDFEKTRNEEFGLSLFMMMAVVLKVAGFELS